MLSEIFNPILEALKLAPRYFLALGAFCAFLLFAPAEFLKHIALDDFAQNYRTALGLAFVASVSLLLVSAGLAVSRGISGWWQERQLYRRIAERLNSLTEDEKQILRFYMAEQTKANMLRIDDDVVKGLVTSGIIYRSASVGNILEGFAHNISEFAWNYLQVNPHVLNGTTNTYRTDRREGLW